MPMSMWVPVGSHMDTHAEWVPIHDACPYVADSPDRAGGARSDRKQGAKTVRCAKKIRTFGAVSNVIICIFLPGTIANRRFFFIEHTVF